MKRILCAALVVIQLSASAQHMANVLKRLIQADSFHIKYKEVLENPAKYHLEVIYTQINRDSNNEPHLHKYALYPETKNYYYPASLVKLPLVAMALEKLNRLKIKGLTKDTRLQVDSAYYCQKKQWRDTTSKNHFASIALFIKKMLLVSDNYSYNRLYEFLGPAYINKRLHEMGYKHIMVNQRFGWGCDSNANRVTPPFTFLSDDSSTVIYRQLKDSNALPIATAAKNTIIGRGFYKDGKIQPPRDFRTSNYIPFEDENNILLSIIFPEKVDSAKRFDLTDSDYMFLYHYMSMLPRESDYPHFNQKDFPDNLKKYVYFGMDDTIRDSLVRSFNIVGKAYGFMSDCAYIVDVQNHVEYCLSATMWVCKKGILNTDDYQYDTISLPFMADLGHLIYNYEKKRKKKYPADLSRMQFRYP